MSSSETSFESSLLLTVLFVTMKTRLARTVGFLYRYIRTVLMSQVVKSVIVNMTALSNATSPPTLSVVSVVTLATWLVIALTAREAATGATAVTAAALELLVLVMPSTGRWSNSCTNSPAARLVKRLLAVLRPVLDTLTMTVT